jgi:hypothetical protein
MIFFSITLALQNEALPLVDLSTMTMEEESASPSLDAPTRADAFEL